MNVSEWVSVCMWFYTSFSFARDTRQVKRKNYKGNIIKWTSRAIWIFLDGDDDDHDDDDGDVRAITKY